MRMCPPKPDDGEDAKCHSMFEFHEIIKNKRLIHTLQGTFKKKNCERLRQVFSVWFGRAHILCSGLFNRFKPRNFSFNFLCPILSLLLLFFAILVPTKGNKK